MYLYFAASSNLPPAESRHLNKDCVLFHFYDNHDIWHFLSATSLFLSFMILLTWDDDLENTPRNKIPVFWKEKRKNSKGMSISIFDIILYKWFFYLWVLLAGIEINKYLPIYSDVWKRILGIHRIQFGIWPSASEKKRTQKTGSISFSNIFFMKWIQILLITIMKWIQCWKP